MRVFASVSLIATATLRPRVSATLIALLALALSPCVALAGSNNADLDCVSTSTKSEKIRVSGRIPGDFGEFSLTVSVATSSITMTEGSHTIEVDEDFPKRVFSISVSRGGRRELHLRALPKSIRYRTGNYRDMDAEFSAVLVEAPDLDQVEDSATNPTLREIPLRCTYHFSV